MLKEVEFEQKRVHGWINRVEPNCGVLTLQNKRVYVVNQSFAKVHCRDGHNTHTFLDQSVHQYRVCVLQQCISHQSGHENHLGILKCRF